MAEVYGSTLQSHPCHRLVAPLSCAAQYSCTQNLCRWQRQLGRCLSCAAEFQPQQGCTSQITPLPPPCCSPFLCSTTWLHANPVQVAEAAGQVPVAEFQLQQGVHLSDHTLATSLLLPSDHTLATSLLLPFPCAAQHSSTQKLCRWQRQLDRCLWLSSSRSRGCTSQITPLPPPCCSPFLCSTT